MTDKKKEKDQYYFKIIPKEEFSKFIERFKEALEKDENKKGDKKTFVFEIRGTREILNGFDLEIFSFDKSKYEEFIDIEQEYIKNSLYCISLNLITKEESGVELLESLFQQWKPLLQQLLIQEDKYDFFFRKKGKRVSIDWVAKDGKLIKALLDLGIDFSEYQRFNLSFLMGINVYDLLFELEDPTLIFIKMLSIIFSIKSETENWRYLLIALAEALKDVKINDDKIQKMFNKFMGNLALLNSFIGTKFIIEFDGKILAEKILGGSEKLKAKINIIKQMLFEMVSIPTIKSIDFNKISLSLCVPKYKNGFALSIKTS